MTIAEISELIGLIITGVGLIFTLVKWIKELKDKKLKELIEKYMIEAEKSGQSGVAKKTFVIASVIQELKISSQGKIDSISKYIEDCIDFSKKINNKK